MVLPFSIVPIDWQLTDTYYVVAHLHYVFIGGTIFGLFAGFVFIGSQKCLEKCWMKNWVNGFSGYLLSASMQHF